MTMRRFFLNTAKVLLFLSAFLGALWVFFPWEKAGQFVMSKGHSYVSSRGLRMTYSDVTGTTNGFTVHNLCVFGPVNFAFSSITIRPSLVSSVLSLQPICDIEFRGGQVQLGSVIDFGTGGTLLTVDPSSGEIFLENLRTSGPFGINGYVSVSPQARRITRADARLSVPEEFLPNMNMLTTILPLVNEGGQWYLRRR